MTTLRAWLAEAPFELVLSGGFFGFYAHAGMVDALATEGLLPTAACGSSAGALVAAAWASGLSTRSLMTTLGALRREEFWDPAPGLGLLRGALFRARLESLLPVRRFEDCGVPLAVSVFDLRARATRVITSGELAPAVVASCAVPLLFHPVRHEGRLLVDGGVRDRSGLAASRGTRRLVHHLAARPWRVPRTIQPSTSLVALVIEGLPRPGPRRLEAGVRAMALARDATMHALDRTITDHVVCVAA